MRDYELAVIIHPDLEENAFREVLERVKGWMSQDGGEISKVDVWGRRRLAYPIRKLREGQYVIIQSRMDPARCKELERNLRLLEPVMRFMLVAK